MVVCHLLLQADGEGPYPHLLRRLLRHTDIRHPDLLRPRRDDLVWPGLEQIRMAVKAMVTVCGLMVRPLRRDQQAGCTQQIEQTVPSQLDSRFNHSGLQQVVQLPCSQSGLAQAHVPYPLDHFAVPFGTAAFTLVALVIGLAAQMDISAGPAHAQPLDEPLGKDLPEGFFTTRTP